MKIKFIVLLVLIFNAAWSQKSKPTEVIHDSKGRVTFARYNVNETKVPNNAAPEFLKSELALSNHDRVELLETDRDNIGILHQTYQQYYKNVKVAGGIYKVHGRNSIETINGL